MFDLILDRDGVLNMDVAFAHRVEDYKAVAGRDEGLIVLRDLGARMSIATGQSGIARGIYREEDMAQFNHYLLEDLGKSGIKIEALVYCPHHPDISGDCVCRKPKTGMLELLEGKLGSVDWSTSWGIGDKPSDAEMMLNMGGRAILMVSGPNNNPAGNVYWRKEDSDVQQLLATGKVFIASDMVEAAEKIKHERQKEGL